MQCHTFDIPAPTLHSHLSHLVEGRWSLSNKDLGAGCLGNAVRKRELEFLGEELLDVWALDVFGLLELNNLEDVD